MGLEEKRNVVGRIFLYATIVGVILILLATSKIHEDSMVDKVYLGKVKLFCMFEDGERQVDGKDVIDFINGYWIFNNGSAKNCRTEEV